MTYFKLLALDIDGTLVGADQVVAGEVVEAVAAAGAAGIAVCVATGRTYTIDRDDINTLPVKNPDTGERSLVPCVKREGRLYADAHYRGLLQAFGEVNQHVDEDTMVVRMGP